MKIHHKTERLSYYLTIVVLLCGLLAPLIAASRAEAAQLTNRSVQISDAAPNANNVTYNFNFTPVNLDPINFIAIGFCQSALPNPAGGCLNDEFADVDTSNIPTPYNITDMQGIAGTWVAGGAGVDSALSAFSVEGQIPSGAPISFSVAGFANPATIGTVYVRIMTSLIDFQDPDPDAVANMVDEGVAAFSINDPVEVSAAIRETLTFCVSSEAIDGPTAACSRNDTNPLPTPSIQLGEGTGDDISLSPTAVSTSDIYFQLTTNAANSTSINIKGDNNLTSGSNSIDGLATLGEITAGSGSYGIFIPTSSLGGNLAVDSSYGSNLAAAYMPAEITDTYGDTIAAAPGVEDMAGGMITFAASPQTDTPAGLYTARYSLIATPSY